MEALQYQYAKPQLPRQTNKILFSKKCTYTHEEIFFSLLPTVNLQKSQYVDYFQQGHANHIINTFTYFQLLYVISLLYFAVLLH